MNVAYPLLAPLLPDAGAVDVDREAGQRQQAIDRHTATMRALQCRVWRDSRRDYFAATPEQRAAIRAAWEAWRGPTTALYFRYVVDLHTGIVEARSAAHAEAEARRWRARGAGQAMQSVLDLG